MSIRSGREEALSARANEIESRILDQGISKLSAEDWAFLQYYQGRRLEGKMDTLTQAVDALKPCIEGMTAAARLSSWRGLLTPRNVITTLFLLAVIARGPEFLFALRDILKAMGGP